MARQLKKKKKQQKRQIFDKQNKTPKNPGGPLKSNDKQIHHLGLCFAVRAKLEIKEFLIVEERFREREQQLMRFVFMFIKERE
jgi:hypothetical protein